MSFQTFIDEAYLKDVTTVDLNVDPKLITSTILYAQDIYIRPILGSTLYTEIKNQISGNTVSNANADLLNNYIQICLAHWTLLELLPEMVFQLRNRGIQKQFTDFSESVSMDELKYKMELQKNKAQNYSERMRLFLLENSSTYPSYQNPGSGIDVTYPDRQSFSSGMILESDLLSCLRGFGLNNENIGEFL